MLHPSYSDLIEVANKHVEEGSQPIVSSRYSIILAAAKRARQLVEGADPLVHGNEKKPLSVAVDELAEDQIHILPYGSGGEESRKAVPSESAAVSEEEGGEATDRGEEPREAEAAEMPEESAEKETEEE